MQAPPEEVAYRTVHGRSEGLSSQGQLGPGAASGPLTPADDGAERRLGNQIEESVIHGGGDGVVEMVGSDKGLGHGSQGSGMRLSQVKLCASALAEALRLPS